MIWVVYQFVLTLDSLWTLVFLNKCDLLEKKLKAGVNVRKYIPRYGDRENSKMSLVIPSLPMISPLAVIL